MTVVDGVKNGSLAQMRAIEVVQRRDRHDLFGVTVPGARFVCALPAGYQPLKMKLAFYDGHVLVVQHDMPPLKCNCDTGKVETVESDSMIQIAKEMPKELH